MDPERRAYLSRTGEAPTPEEALAGYHYCAEWDWDLSGPGMPEMESCLCRKREG